ncbi:PriCT-2 domain-containing protein [Polaromonas sp. P1(28)-13]|nr:PriCT-2 domain-containing protein [Polaromonas sp. P1(28)-13]
MLLSGHCDRQCKDPSRLYFEPSCPQEAIDDAFFESNDGELLDPDFLIELARQCASQQVAIFEGNNLIDANQKRPPSESPEEIGRVKAMLATIPSDCDREQWRNVVWAIAATGWSCAESLACEWSKSAPEKFVTEEFSKVWVSFKSDSGIGFGSLVHYAKQAGWVNAQKPADIEIAKPDTRGDILNGQVLAQTYKDKLLFVHESGDVLMFEETAGWIHAPTGEADRAGKAVVNLLRAHAAEQWKVAPDDTRTKRLMAHVERSSTAQKSAP